MKINEETAKGTLGNLEAQERVADGGVLGSRVAMFLCGQY